MAEYPTPSDAAVQWLQSNQDRTTDFDTKFGPGAAASVLQAAPAPAATPEGAPEDQPSMIGDMARGVVSGAQEAFGELMQTGKSLDTALGNALESVGIPSQVQIMDPETGEFSPQLLTQSEAEAKGGNDAFFGGPTGDTSQTMEVDIVNRPVTTAGKITEGVTQFVAGLLVTKRVTGLSGFKGTVAAGAVTDAVFFDPQGGNLQNFLDENEWAIPIVTDALAVDPEDAEWTARLKNSVDGLIAGGVVDSFVKGIKASALYLKSTRVADSAHSAALRDEATKLAAEASDEAKLVLDEGLPPEALPEQPSLPGFEPEPPKAPVSADAMAEASSVAAEVATKGNSKGAGGYVDAARLKLAVEGAAATRHVYQAGEAAGNLDSLLTENWFNYSKMDGPVEAVAMIDTMGKALEDSGALKLLNLDKPEKLSTTLRKASREVASLVNVGVDDFAGRLEKLAVGTVDQAKMIVAGKMTLQTMGREISKLAEQVDNAALSGKGSEELERKLIDLMETHASVQMHLKGVQTAAARATSAGRVRTKDALDAAALDKLQSFGGSERVRKLAKMLRASAGDNQTAQIIRRATKPGMIDVINEYWINAVLSGYKTHMVNITSNAINIALLPAERMAGGAIQGLRGQGFGQMREGANQYIALRSSVMDSLRLAGRAFVDEDSVLDVTTKVDLSSKKAIKASTFGASESSLGGKLIEGVGKLARLPSRFLVAEDEFFKQLSFRSRLQAQLMEASHSVDLKKLGYANKGAFVKGEFDAAFNRLEDLEVEFQKMVDLGKVVDDPKLKEEFISAHIGSFKAGNHYAEEAIRSARAATFTTPLAPNSLPGRYQKLTNHHPILRQITPFIQTPTNILITALDRTPGLGLIRSRFREQLRSPDAAVRAEAQGKLATGVAITTAVSMLAYEGRLTGGGPVDPKVRAVWQNDPNWQPYSINVGSDEKPHWIAFDRMDPHGFLFGIVADMMEMQQASEMDPSFDQGTLFSMAAASAANNLTSKTWLKGIADFVEILNAKDRPWVVDAWARNKVASFTPFSSMGRQINQGTDAHMVEARSYADKMMANVPGMTDRLPTRFSWLTGQAVDTPSHMLGYIAQKQTDGDIVGEELRRLGYGFRGPDRRIGEIELSSEMYQEWNKLMGSLKVGGRTLKERLQRTMETDRYDIKRERVPDGIGDPSESHRVTALADIMERYKSYARAELMEKYPELADAHRAARIFKRKAQAGRAEPGERENLFLKF